jgi:hypothetical protein
MGNVRKSKLGFIYLSGKKVKSTIKLILLTYVFIFIGHVLKGENIILHTEIPSLISSPMVQG